MGYIGLHDGPRRCLLRLGALTSVVIASALAGGLVVAASSKTTDPKTFHAAAGANAEGQGYRDCSPIRIQFDVRRFAVYSLTKLKNGHDALFAIDRGASGESVIEDLETGADYYIHPGSEQPSQRTEITLSRWSTWGGFSNADVYQTLRLGSDRLTLIPTDHQTNVVPPGFFYGSCLSPVSSYIQFDTPTNENAKVLLYVFPEKVRLRPTNRCEDDVYSSPHSEVRIIDPVLVGLERADGSILLAGRSYTSMPVVIIASERCPLIGDESTYFIVDKEVVEELQRNAVAGFERVSRDHPLDASSAAELAVLIERRLLEYTLTLRRKEH